MPTLCALIQFVSNLCKKCDTVREHQFWHKVAAQGCGTRLWQCLTHKDMLRLLLLLLLLLVFLVQVLGVAVVVLLLIFSVLLSTTTTTITFAMTSQPTRLLTYVLRTTHYVLRTAFNVLRTTTNTNAKTNSNTITDNC